MVKENTMTKTVPHPEAGTDATPTPAASTSVTTSVAPPDVGDTFARDTLAPCVVTAWLKRVPTQPLPTDLANLFPDPPARPPLLVFCDRDQAEYVSAYCGHGVVVPVEDVTVNGRAPWSATHMDHARRRARALVGSYAYASCPPRTARVDTAGQHSHVDEDDTGKNSDSSEERMT
jgi:hypothetical protein